MVITLTDAGYVKRVRADEYRLQKRGGRGIAGTALKDDDLVRDLFVTTTHHWLLFFTDRGLVHRVRAWQVPEKSRTARGTFVANVEGLELDRDEQIRAIVAVRDWADAGDQYLVFATKQGIVKRTRLAEYDSPRMTLIAINCCARTTSSSACRSPAGPRGRRADPRVAQGQASALPSAVRAIGRNASGVSRHAARPGTTRSSRSPGHPRAATSSSSPRRAMASARRCRPTPPTGAAARGSSPPASAGRAAG